MSDIKYTCERGDGHTLSFYPGGGGKSGFRISHGSSDDFIDLSPEGTADLARRLAEHVGLTSKPEPEPEPEPFKRNAEFEDVRKGDLVRSEWVFQGAERRIEGIADHKSSDQWWTSKGGGFNPTAIRAYGGTLTILSRPEPPELPTTPGAVIKIWLGEEWMRVNLGADGYWRGAWPDGDDMDSTGDNLARMRGLGWDRFEVVA